jgi:hypothetical protein
MKEKVGEYEFMARRADELPFIDALANGIGSWSLLASERHRNLSAS